MYKLCKGKLMLVKKILKILLKIIIAILKFPFKMFAGACYINMGEVDKAKDILDK